MNRCNLSGTKSSKIQNNVGRNQNSKEKINIKVDIASESEEEEVRIVSVDIDESCKSATNNNYLDAIPNIIKNNNNIKITRINNNNSKSLYCTEDCSGPEWKKPKLEMPIYKEVLQDKSNENFRGVCHLRHVGFQQKMFKCPTILRTNDQIKIDDDDSDPAEVNSISCQTDRYPLLSIYNIKNNEKAVVFYTGLQNYEKFLYVFKSLGPDAYDLRYYYYDQTVNLTILDQFFMTLILLRQHKSHYEMSILFDVTLKDIKNIFITWIRFMKLEWSNIKFPSSYITELNINYNKNNPILVEDKDSDIEIEYISKEANDTGTKNSRIIPAKINSFKKIYKILNGPQNYIESHLMNDIVFVCNALCYFKAKRIPHKEQS